MIFKQIAEILDGRKTQTRRVVKDTEFAIPDQWVKVHAKDDATTPRLKWAVGRQYAIIPKRGAAGIGRYIQLIGIRQEHVQAITEADAIAEGVGSVEKYKALWESINKTKGVRWQDNPMCWVLSFKLVSK